jgi:hypothetical protein
MMFRVSATLSMGDHLRESSRDDSIRDGERPTARPEVGGEGKRQSEKRRASHG